MAPGDDQRFMALALQQARLAAAEGEIPVGAVVVKDGVVIGEGRNGPIAHNDPTGHAEIIALRSAASHLGNYRLESCTLYVTVEPCPMCSGAVLQARLARVVFGAVEPKTGAAGSVLNLFTWPTLNHQTRVEGGVLAEECATLMRDFFQDRRSAQKKTHWPLREDALRTPERAFLGLPRSPAVSHFVNDLPRLAGLRMHYVDAGAADSSLVFFCVHGQGAWSYQFQPLMAAAAQAGYRVLAPDLVGYGLSDKPKRISAHSMEMHWQCLYELLQRLDLPPVVLVVAGGAGAWGLGLLPRAADRLAGLLVCPIGAPAESDRAAWDAPFPDTGHQAGLRALPAQADLGPAWQKFMQEKWRAPTLLVRAGAAPVEGEAAIHALPQAPTPERAGLCAVDSDLMWSTFAGR